MTTAEEITHLRGMIFLHCCVKNKI